MEKLVNNSQTTLQTAMNASVLTIRPASGVTWPTSGQFRVHADSELILISGGSGPTYTVLTRGAEGTTAASHVVGITLTIVLTAGSMDVWLHENALTGSEITSVKTADYTVAASDYLVRVNTSGGNVTITLPEASTVVARLVNIKHVTAGNIMTIQRTNVDTIDGAAMVLSNRAGTSLALQAAAPGVWVIE